jgi:hypothetical protein
MISSIEDMRMPCSQGGHGPILSRIVPIGRVRFVALPRWKIDLAIVEHRPSPPARCLRNHATITRHGIGSRFHIASRSRRPLGPGVDRGDQHHVSRIFQASRGADNDPIDTAPEPVEDPVAEGYGAVRSGGSESTAVPRPFPRPTHQARRAAPPREHRAVGSSSGSVGALPRSVSASGRNAGLCSELRCAIHRALGYPKSRPAAYKRHTGVHRLPLRYDSSHTERVISFHPWATPQ